MVYRFEEVLATVEAVKGENERLKAEAEALRGRLREARRANRRLYREASRGRQRLEYCHQMMVAAGGLSVAVVSLIYAAIIIWGNG